MFSKTLTLISLLSAALALPDVTIKSLPAGCSSYPKYSSDTATAGPWSASLANSDNALIEGFGDSTVYSVSYTPETGPVMRWGRITINHVGGIARTALKCTNGKLQAYTETALNRAGAPINVQWTPVALSPYENDAELLYLIDGEQPTVYEHYIGEEKQEGVFLGGYNTTTWGVKWYEASQGSEGFPYFNLRLLPEGQEVGTNETKTFLKIQT
ncbi:Nn.00g029410.m01.CDS01 [Neocucurbitaria sp. VM-36]